MNDPIKDNDGKRNAARKPRRFGWIFEEWVLQGLLVVAAMVAMVNGVLSISGPTII